MPGGLQRPELARAWEAYFVEKGGEAARVDASVVPVVIMDDNSKGPYPSSRVWMAGTVVAGLAANFTYIGIVNDDALGIRSALVIDEIVVRQVTATDDFIISVSDQSTFILGTLAALSDVAAEKDPGGFFGASMSNGKRGSAQTASGIGSTLVPGGPITQATTLRGPWILGPQANFFVRPLTIANGLAAYFRGRYYPTF